MEYELVRGPSWVAISPGEGDGLMFDNRLAKLLRSCA
jgi:hypothetical protein